MRPTAKLLMLLLVVTAATFSTSSSIGTAVCLPPERDALMAFKRGIKNDPAGRLASWRRGGDCCRWRGVRCSNRTGHVLELQLGVDEQMYYDQSYFSGKISPSLFSLEHLEHLDLGYNSLDFPTVVYSSELLGSLKSLKYLNLSNIRFDSTLPSQLGNLTKLQYLDLSYTISSVQPTDMSWLTRLPLLHHLDLSGVNLSRVYDWPHIVNMIPCLQVLYLSQCSLQNANQRLPGLNLTKLVSLDLSDNNFDHPSTSCWFWNLTSLKQINLGYNDLYGQFPSTLGEMKSLQVFDFSFNIGTGRLGSVIVPNMMRNLCNLEVLNLESCLLSGDMTEYYESFPHCSSSRLRVLNLGGNSITGSLPAGIAQLSSLVTLDISFNNLTGPVPSDIGRLNNLTYIDLGYNNLTGVITEEHLAGLTSLRHIDLSKNYLLKIVVDPDRLPPLRLEVAYFESCKIGPLFPSWLQRFTGAVNYFIDMSDTGIADQFPDWFSTALSGAGFLDFSDNQIYGNLPKNLEIMSLNYIHLDGNNISGVIPPLPSNLLYFAAPNNALSGRIPGSICKSHMLQYLNLGNNNLEGKFPQCLRMRNLTNIVLSNNMFSGKFPSFLRSCTDINFLDLSRNKFSGTLPAWIGDFVKIQYLRLSYNMFSGALPLSITNLREMYDFNLAGNRISGNIPWNLSNLKSMAEKHASVGNIAQPFNNFSVVTKRQELYYGDRLDGMVTIDLSLNYITGVIPDEITSLVGLMNLNLSWNYLTGKIPHNIGSMPSLESLDLSRNNLSGGIPPSLSTLTYLAWLDLSYNSLSGRIPSGSQLDTLYNNYPFMYSGNGGLCGPPLQQNCSGGNNATRLGGGDQKRTAHVPDTMFFHFGLGSGFVVGLWVVLLTMLFKETWRIAYFRLFDKVYDKLYVFVVLTWARFSGKTLQLIIRRLG